MTMNEQAIRFFQGCLHDCGNPAFIELALDALRVQQKRENPKPLSLEELREMDGEPERMKKMDRLTHRIGGKYITAGIDEDVIITHPLQYTGKAVDRLAAFEDTGLDPSKIASYRAEAIGSREIINMLQDSLAYYKQLEADGRLVT